MKIISFLAEKGGVSKTTLCFNLCWELSKKHRVLMIDLDGQKSNLTFLCGIPKDDNKTMLSVLSNQINVDQAITPIKKKLDIIGATENVLDVEPTSNNVIRFKSVLERIQNDYDYCFIDCSPSPILHGMVSLISEFVLIPLLPDVMSLESVIGVYETITINNPNAKILGLIFSRYTTQTNLSKQVIEYANKRAAEMGTKVFRNGVRNAVVMSELPLAHIGVTEYDPKSKVANDIKELTNEFIKEIKKHG